MTTTPLAATALSKTYGGRTVLEHFNCHVSAGCVSALIGPAGAGKSTVVRILAGLVRPFGGRATVLGVDVGHEPAAAQRRLAFLPGDRHVASWINAGQFARYYGAFFDDWSAVQSDRLLTRWGIDPAAPLGSMPESLRSLAILAALLGRSADLLILDNPTDGLDPQLAGDVLAGIIEWREESRSVLMTSNRLEEVDRIADTVTILDGGRVTLSGDLEVLRDERKRISVTEAPTCQEIELWPEVWKVTEEGRLTTVTTRRDPEGIIARFRDMGAQHIEATNLTLREIYLLALETDGRGKA